MHAVSHILYKLYAMHRVSCILHIVSHTILLKSAVYYMCIHKYLDGMHTA